MEEKKVREVIKTIKLSDKWILYVMRSIRYSNRSTGKAVG